MNILIFGNGNLSFADFWEYYAKPLQKSLEETDNQYIVGDFRGVDTLVMELLKTETANVSVYHVGEKPRYLPDAFKTKVSEWKLIGGFKNDTQRDLAMIEQCTYFLGIDFNSDEVRKSGTQKNIEKCLSLGKIDLFYM